MPVATTRFFKGLPAKGVTSAFKSIRKTSHFVDVGGNGDCGVRAIAAGIISKVLFEQRSTPELAALLSKHFEYFPEQKPRLPLATPAEQLECMTEKGKMATAIQSLAYTIRQLAVDEMVANPAHYRGAFVGNEAMPTSPEAMRLPTTWIDESVIAAAAKATGFPINVRVVSEGKELPMRLHYSAKKETSVTPLVIQLQNKHYIPSVHHPAPFQAVKSGHMHRVEPRQIAKNDPNLEEVLAKIEREDKRLLKEFEDTKRRLTAAVEVDGAPKELLLNIYIEGLKKSDYLQGYVGIEHGSEDFFKAIKDVNGELEVVRSELDNPDQHFTKQLIHAIARAVTINHLDASEVFEKIESALSDKRVSAHV
ncbi:OTU domain-containing protein [Legionella clemsonensis]|uniref:OTU domain-containing protein n=1 Tax=Legionella clemsonensis TaxID=1867846 RepID=A0A222NYP4_9GAMM|nr:OTU domain-containing protein [Legionella clemsonensis]ASQ44698.1 hypothetical protein clem_00660 [Legionella clemsonensis]